MNRHIIWRWSNETAQWEEKKYTDQIKSDATLFLDGCKYQTMYGFGGCFNELGWRALNKLPYAIKQQVLEELFLPNNEHTNFNFCRVPIGGNDYSFDWYSLDETVGDYELKNFSIDRDSQALIPYIKEAKRFCPDLKLFASPWSPPTWMKEPPVYHGGKLHLDQKTQKAYANYLVKFVEAYAKQNIEIKQVHIQNEPVADQKFPSCLWTGEELRDFIKNYLGPIFKKELPGTELWLGTINAPGCDYNRLIFDKWATEDYDYFANVVLSDQEALQYLTGVSYQWGGKIAIERTYESWYPRIRLMQSENECGFGDNTWEYARYIWTMLKHYISNGAESYIYWNMILETKGISTWGDSQNSMITVDTNLKTAIFNPEFYVMKHFSCPIQRGAVRLGTKGTFSGDTLAFLNPDGSIVLELLNPFKKAFTILFQREEEVYTFELEPQSVNSIIIK